MQCTYISNIESRWLIGWLLEEASCDAVIDYKLAGGDPEKFQQQLRKALQQVDSKGFDIFFDNVVRNRVIKNAKINQKKKKKIF